MKYTRLIIGVAIIIVAGWIIIGEQITGASANAVVNAPLSTVRAPIAGQLSLPDRGLGAAVSDGEEIATVTDARVDRVRLDNLLMERAFDYLDAPVINCTGKDVPMPYAANLEKLALTSTDEVIEAVRKVTYR